MALLDRIKALIGATGPLSIPQYMDLCLHDPREGYYATRPALGEGGDFITAPLVSQMFGEIIGVWLIETWRRMGRPSVFRLVEMGPGDGTLMADIQRTVRQDPDFLTGQDVWLVETSSPLRALQAERLGDRVQWAAALDEVPPGVPILLVANELLDCLPARQFVRTASGWAERGVGLNNAGALTFGLMGTLPATAFPDGPVESILEVSAAQEDLARILAHRIKADGGAALLIDYGRSEPGFGDTLQALQRHQKVSPLATPGQADLTVHADFPAVVHAAVSEGLPALPILTQGAFLTRLGMVERAEALAASRPDQFEVLERQLNRLLSPAEMGDLFKVVCLAQPSLTPPAFEAPNAATGPDLTNLGSARRQARLLHPAGGRVSGHL